MCLFGGYTHLLPVEDSVRVPESTVPGSCHPIRTSVIFKRGYSFKAKPYFSAPFHFILMHTLDGNYNKMYLRITISTKTLAGQFLLIDSQSCSYLDNIVIRRV